MLTSFLQRLQSLCLPAFLALSRGRVVCLRDFSHLRVDRGTWHARAHCCRGPRRLCASGVLSASGRRRTSRANGSLRIKSSVERWNFLISRNATVPGLWAKKHTVDLCARHCCSGSVVAAAPEAMRFPRSCCSRPPSLHAACRCCHTSGRCTRSVSSRHSEARAARAYLELRLSPHALPALPGHRPYACGVA